MGLRFKGMYFSGLTNLVGEVLCFSTWSSVGQVTSVEIPSLVILGGCFYIVVKDMCFHSS